MLTLTLIQPQKTQTKQTATELVTPMIYVAAAYSEPDPVANTKHAIRIADALLQAGFTPLVPHLTMLWDLVSPKPYEEWLDYENELLARCDAVLRVPGYSVGAKSDSRNRSASPSSVPAPRPPRTASAPSATGRCMDDLHAVLHALRRT